MDLIEKLAKERRARLAAERLLEQKQRELWAANEKLALHARALSEQIVEQRSATRDAVSEAEALKTQNARFVTDLDRAHTAAVMAERRMWDSINTIRDGFAVYDSAHRLTVANRAYLNLFQNVGILPGAEYGKLLTDAAEKGLVVTGGASPPDWANEMIARWDHDVIEPVVIQFSDGRYLRMIEQRSRDGDMVCLALNITEEMRIWAAIEAIPDGFVLFDRDDRLLRCNQRYRELYPESSEAMVEGASFEAILRHGLKNGQYIEAVGREEEWLKDRLARHLDLEGILEQPLANGRWLRILEQRTPDGGRVGLRVDITELKAQQTALETARSAAEAANRAKSAFLANMSHEIRTPMNGVVGMAELLCDTSLTEEQRLFAETIRSSGEALLVIINDILDYSKIEAERLTLHPEPFDLERTIHEVTMLLQPKARAKGIDLLIDYDMFLPTRFVGDPGRLRQILTNLIGNAVKFTEAGHVLVRAIGLDSDDGEKDLHITIEDTGIGIAPENIDHVFGEFNQVESQQNRKFEGTGLGLAITKRLIELMGGSVWVESDLGKGSCFGLQLSLPVAEQEPAPRAPITVKRALVVDDQFINRTILQRQLQPHGIDVTLCRSAVEALEILSREAAFDVILTDHDMPEIDGLEFMQQVRARGIETPAVILSSSPAIARDQGAELKLSGILQKPLLRADLYRHLQAITAPQVVVHMERAEIEPVNCRKMRVLAAEDNRTNQLVLQKMVKDCAIELVFANNGREAVELFKSFSPDMIFMDISMPEMDGRQAAAAIRGIEAGRSHIPIVALTAHAMEGDGAALLAAGLDRYLTKPLRKSAIVGAMSELRPAGTCEVEAAGELEKV